MKNQNKNIILLGPKAVGKSLVSGALKEKLSELGYGDYEILNLDLFFNFCKDAHGNNLFLSSMENQRLISSEISKIDKSRKDYDFLVSTLKSEFEEWIETKYRWNEIFKFPDFEDIMASYEKVNEIQQLSHHFDTETLVYFNQLVFLQILKRCLEKTDIPLIIDAGANIGSKIEFNPKFRSDLENLFVSICDGKNMDTFQREVLSKISNRVFLSPGEDYSQTTCTAVNDETNAIYSKNLESYADNANIMISVNSLFYNKNGNEFKTRELSDISEKIDRQKLLNKSELNSVCEQIIEMVKQLEQYNSKQK